MQGAGGGGDAVLIMSCLGRPQTRAFISLAPKHIEKVARDPEGRWRKDQREMKLKTEIHASMRKKDKHCRQTSGYFFLSSLFQQLSQFL